MPKDLLDRTEVGATLDHVGGSGVAKDVRGHSVGVETRPDRMAPDDEKHALTRQLPASCVEEHPAGVAPPCFHLEPDRQVGGERIDGEATERNDPLLVALSLHERRLAVEIDVFDTKADRLGNASNPLRT